VTKLMFIVDESLDADLEIYNEQDIFFRTNIHELIEQTSLISSSSIAHNLIPSPFIAGVVLAEKNKKMHEAVIQKCKNLFPWFDETLIIVAPQLDFKILAWIVRSIASLSQKIAIQASRADQENAEIRILYEKAQSALFEIEAFKGKQYSPRILLQILPGNRSIKISAASFSMSILQEFKSIHAVDLLFDRSGSAISNAEIVVELKGVESGLIIAAWCISESQLKDGWNRFYCPIRNEAIDESIAVSVSSTTAARQFTLRSGELPDGQDAVSVTSDARDPVAIRLWSGLPGIALPRTQAGFSMEDRELTDAKFVSRVELLQLGNAIERDQAQLIAWKSESEALLVHPQGIQPVIACIAKLDVTDLSLVSVSCKLDHPEAERTDFSAWNVRSTETLSTKPLSQTRNGTPRFWPLGGRKSHGRASVAMIPPDARWLTLTAGQEGEISFVVDPAYTGTVDLFLATRNKTSLNHYAWAMFTDVRFEFSTHQSRAEHAGI
jgi:Family of unknown function (DUF6212)